MNRPLAITVGDLAGVGPELVLRTFGELRAAGPVVVYGHAAWLRAALASLASVTDGSWPSTILTVLEPTECVSLDPRVLPVIDAADLAPPAGAYPWGQAVAELGRLQHAALCRAIDDAMTGEVDAIVTAPWHKARLRDAGLAPTGHTEVLRERSGADDVVMVLAGDVLRVALATAHVPLREVADALSTERIVFTARTLAAGLRRDWGIETPHVALCGLNPHAGEAGVLGHEDDAIVAPAIADLRAHGVDASGPWPADTLFPRVAAGVMRADGIVAMYHDQGLGPLKTAHFGEAANITLGLPFVRTSVDHGTAYDIAGRGEASTSSFVYAARLARAFAHRREGS